MRFDEVQLNFYDNASARCLFTLGIVIKVSGLLSLRIYHEFRDCR